MELPAESDALQLSQACFLCAKSDFSLFDAAGSELLIYKAFFMKVSDACQAHLHTVSEKLAVPCRGLFNLFGGWLHQPRWL